MPNIDESYTHLLQQVRPQRIALGSLTSPALGQLEGEGEAEAEGGSGAGEEGSAQLKVGVRKENKIEKAKRELVDWIAECKDSD